MRNFLTHLAVLAPLMLGVSFGLDWLEHGKKQLCVRCERPYVKTEWFQAFCTDRCVDRMLHELDIDHTGCPK